MMKEYHSPVWKQLDGELYEGELVMVNLLMVRKRWLMLMVTEYHSGVWKQLGQNPSPAFLKVIDLPSNSWPPSLSSSGGFLGLLHHIPAFLASFN